MWSPTCPRPCRAGSRNLPTEIRYREANKEQFLGDAMFQSVGSIPFAMVLFCGPWDTVISVHTLQMRTCCIGDENIKNFCKHNGDSCNLKTIISYFLGQQKTKGPEKGQAHSAISQPSILRWVILYFSFQTAKHLCAKHESLVILFVQGSPAPSFSVQFMSSVLQIMFADYFGCSARPSCNGYLVFTCLFTPKYVFCFLLSPATTQSDCITITAERRKTIKKGFVLCYRTTESDRNDFQKHGPKNCFRFGDRPPPPTRPPTRPPTYPPTTRTYSR